MNLFNYKSDEPLSYRLKPDSLDNFYGQEHILGQGKPLRELIESDKIKSLILFGPPGTGKSLLAILISKKTKSKFFAINAVTSNVTELRDLIKQARYHLNQHQEKSIIFIDEIHRFNKMQQDALLPSIESGEIILIGVTTQNPFFYIVPALQSRSFIFEFLPLDEKALLNILNYALKEQEKGLGQYNISIEEALKSKLIQKSAGDARKLLNFIELSFILAKNKEEQKIIITENIVEQALQQKFSVYDKDQDYHYNIISAFIKSMRGSDPDAAIYYLARMLEAGEDPLFIARRMVILASEDVGNADPLALIHAQACLNAVHAIGMPEARIILAQTCTYLATAPKSNASYMAVEKALQEIKNGEILEVPNHLKSTSYQGAEKLGYGKDYKYPHDYPFHYTPQQYLAKEKKYYEPTEIGFEKKIKQRMEFLKSLATKKNNNQ